MTKKMPSIDEVNNLVRCDFSTGKLYWKERPDEMFGGSVYQSARIAKSWNAKFSGKEAGSPNGTGHLRLTICGVRIVAHWIVWAIYYGEWPPADSEIDHKNLNGLDNRPDNLRLATRSQNSHNKIPPSSNVSGVKGVSWHKAGGKWQVKFGLDGKQYYLGLFSDFDEAVKVRAKAVVSIMGEFSREPL